MLVQLIQHAPSIVRLRISLLHAHARRRLILLELLAINRLIPLLRRVYRAPRRVARREPGA
jgi:hypothetical protein